MQKFQGAIIFLIFQLFFVDNFWSQCASVPAQQTCTSGCTALTSNANINSGETYCYTGTGTLSNINFSGGTIIVCGSLTISSGNFNGGTIYVSSTGSLTMPSANLGNYTVVNYGAITVNGNLTCQPATIYNATASSTFTVNGQLTLNNSSSIINNGLLSATTLLIQTTSVPALCLGTASTTNLGSLTNNTTNSISSPSGSACIHISTNMYLNDTLSNTSGLHICMSTGATTGGNATVGSAQLYANCSTCTTALPIELLSFTATIVNRITELNWTTATESNSSHFDVERSADGYSFVKIGEVAAAGNSSQELNYKFFDENPLEGVSYYRIKLVDIDNYTKNSEIRTIYNKPLELINVYPNPVVETVNISIGANKNSDVDVFVYNTLGQLIIRKSAFIQSGTTTLNLDVSQLSQAVYLFKVVTEEGDQVESVFLRK